MIRNIVIRNLLIYDFVSQFGFGLIAPIFAIYVLDVVGSDAIRVVGTAATAYWLGRVLSSVPLARFMDRFDGERDEYYFLLLGNFITSTIPLFFLLATEPTHFYIIQFIHGISNSMLVPGWRILFTNHLDGQKRGFQWSLDDVSVGLAIASSAYVGSLLAAQFGFQILLVAVSVIGYVATLLIIPLHTRIFVNLPKNRELVTDQPKKTLIKGA